jgi:hypothetical protein
MCVNGERRFIEQGSSKYQIMQFSTLRDYKRTEEYPEGQETYEGDVAKVIYGNEVRIGKVIFELGSFYVQNKSNRMALAGLQKIGFPFEVIGNIWDNPDLLK